MNKEDLTEAIADGIHEGANKVAWSITKGMIIAIAAVVVLAIFFMVHNARYGEKELQQAVQKNVNGWGNEYSCFFDNENTPCGKTQYCATHQTPSSCMELNGTWELETEARFWKQWMYYNFLNKNLTREQ